MVDACFRTMKNGRDTKQRNAEIKIVRVFRVSQFTIIDEYCFYRKKREKKRTVYVAISPRHYVSRSMSLLLWVLSSV